MTEGASTDPKPWIGSVLYDPSDAATDIAWRVHAWLLTTPDGELVLQRLKELGLVRDLANGFVEVAALDFDTFVDAVCDVLGADGPGEDGL